MSAPARGDRLAGLDAHIVVTRGTLHLDLALGAGPGEVVALLGPNGSGKTTALRVLAGLLPLAAGRVTVDGSRWDDAGPTRIPARARHTGLVLADHLLFPHLSALENVAFGPRSRGVGRAVARERARRELGLVGLTERAGSRPDALSTGQAQRVALARALATDPALLLLDEPLAALDPSTRGQTRADLAHRLRAFPGVTLLVTHDPLDALTLADRLVFLEGGRVVQSGTPAEVVARPRSAYVAEVVGLNLYAGDGADGGVVRLPGAAVVTSDPVAGRVWVTVPPSAVSLFLERPHGSPRNTWSMRVRDVQVSGQRVRVAMTGPLELTAEVTPGAVAELGLGVGSQVWASVKATEVRAYER